MKTAFLTLLLSTCACLAQMGLRSPAWVAEATASATSSGTPPSSLVTNLVAYWRLDETGVTDQRVDATGRGNTLLTNSGTSGGIEGIAGLITNCSVFTSNNLEYLSCADNADLSTENASWTFAGWFLFYTTNVVHDFAGKYVASNPNREWSLERTQNGNIEFAYSTNGGTSTSISGLISANTGLGRPTTNVWTFIAGVVDGTTMEIRLYIDMKGRWTNAIPSINGTAGNGAFTIGFNARNSRYLDGRADECGFWRQVLTTNALNSLYNSGIGVTYPFTGIP